MITYELAKELKDAGFSFNKTWLNRDGTYCETPYNFDREYLIPTLSELIEACGSDFSSLQKKMKGWYAVASNFVGVVSDEGNTPEEAVARLWLALNKK